MTMDGFSIIQHFFSRMRCQCCTAHLDPHGVELLRQENSVYVVHVHCIQCNHQMGIALVGLQRGEAKPCHDGYLDPELTPEEIERLSKFEAIDYDDVVDAHRFFSTLPSDWSKYLPQETLEWEISLEPESDMDEVLQDLHHCDQPAQSA